MRLSLQNNRLQNPFKNADVDRDGGVNALDVLNIVNRINSIGTGAVLPKEIEAGILLDVDGDGDISPLDALFVAKRRKLFARSMGQL